MRKSILYTGITFILYILLSAIITLGLYYFIGNDYLYYQESFVYLVSILFILIFIKKRKLSFFTENNKTTMQSVAFVIFLALLFRLMKDPVLRLDLIFGKTEFPTFNYKNEISKVTLMGKVLLMVILGPIFEELFFRKIMLNFFSKEYKLSGVFIASLLFSVIHIDDFSIDFSNLILNFIFGLIACFIYLNRGILYSILFHLSYNAIWILMAEYTNEYWSAIQTLNFGFIYWLIVSISYMLFFIITWSLKFNPRST